MPYLNLRTRVEIMLFIRSDDADYGLQYLYTLCARYEHVIQVQIQLNGIHDKSFR